MNFVIAFFHYEKELSRGWLTRGSQRTMNIWHDHNTPWTRVLREIIWQEALELDSDLFWFKIQHLGVSWHLPSDCEHVDKRTIYQREILPNQCIWSQVIKLNTFCGHSASKIFQYNLRTVRFPFYYLLCHICTMITFQILCTYYLHAWKNIPTITL